MKFANPSPGRPVFLDNVQFRLFDTKGLNNEDALLQIKFYKLKNGNIEGETINSIPVNVPLSSLKKNNTIKNRRASGNSAEWAFGLLSAAGVE